MTERLDPIQMRLADLRGLEPTAAESERIWRVASSAFLDVQRSRGPGWLRVARRAAVAAVAAAVLIAGSAQVLAATPDSPLYPVRVAVEAAREAVIRVVPFAPASAPPATAPVAPAATVSVPPLPSAVPSVVPTLSAPPLPTATVPPLPSPSLPLPTPSLPLPSVSLPLPSLPLPSLPLPSAAP